MAFPYVVQRLPDNRALVFGLGWQVLIGKSLDQLALKTARRARASHYVRGGSRSHAVGLIKLKRADVTKGTLYSAAAAFARAHPTGAVVARIQLPDGVWVGASLNGVVLVDGDVVHPDAASANNALEAWRDKHPGLIVFGDDADQPLSPTALMGQLNGSTELRAATFRLSSVPVPVRITIALGLAALASQQGLAKWKEHQRAQARAANAASAANAPELWRDAVRAWAADTRVDGKAGLGALVAEIKNVPVELARWQLRDISCDATAANWSCQARYARSPLGTNEGLIAAKPAKWSMAWAGVDAATASWQIARYSEPLAPAALPSSDQVEQMTISRWQEIGSALDGIKIEPAAPVAIPAPVVYRPDGTSQPVPFPASAGPALPKAHGFEASGPLRTFSLAPLEPSAALTNISMRYLPGTVPSLSRSVLMTTLKGVIYAQ